VKLLLSNILKRIFSHKSSSSSSDEQPLETETMKYLIVGLGNIGAEYQGTRHNIGFTILDAFAEASNVVFATQRYGAVAQMRLKNQRLVLLKPSTYMNLSGEAVRYWMQKEKIELDHVLVVVDDLALPFGTIRLRGKGADGGHNGLKNINTLVGSQNYARLRFGIGSDFPEGAQVDYVLGPLTNEELQILPERVGKAVDAIKAFCLSGLSFAMTHYNNK
jgi:PTH1 family peptidyl-tRNA hydrolase